MKITLHFIGLPELVEKLVVEPLGEEFDVFQRGFSIEFDSRSGSREASVEMDFRESKFLYIDTPRGFRPKVMIDGVEDERPSFNMLS